MVARSKGGRLLLRVGLMPLPDPRGSLEQRGKTRTILAGFVVVLAFFWQVPVAYPRRYRALLCCVRALSHRSAQGTGLDILEVRQSVAFRRKQNKMNWPVQKRRVR